MWLIAGLGNPGPEYRDTRHNVGFRVVDEIARRHGLSFRRSDWSAQAASGAVCGQSIVLLKPQTYMNESGRSVGRAAAYYKLEPAQVLIIHDDIDLALARLRFRSDGSHGGNNGVRSIIASLRTDLFWRLKIGVGRPRIGDAADHVLSPFAADERPTIEDALDRAATAVERFLRDGPEAAMNGFND